jgi:hypothetical protein
MNIPPLGRSKPTAFDRDLIDRISSTIEKKGGYWLDSDFDYNIEVATDETDEWVLYVSIIPGRNVLVIQWGGEPRFEISLEIINDHLDLVVDVIYAFAEDLQNHHPKDK